MKMEELRFPVGKFSFDGELTGEQKQKCIEEIAAAPKKLRAAVAGLSAEQLDTPYRPEGWTVRQVVHHVPDSHMNAFTRFKLALTEDEPTIKPYNEAEWAKLDDVTGTAIEVSLSLMDSLHQRWVVLLKSLKPEDLKRKFKHPELGLQTLERSLAMYAWHGRHHVAHITSLRDRNGWK
jgi:uncharacterized damage-inducible protein DinB